MDESGPTYHLKPIFSRPKQGTGKDYSSRNYGSQSPIPRPVIKMSPRVKTQTEKFHRSLYYVRQQDETVERGLCQVDPVDHTKYASVDRFVKLVTNGHDIRRIRYPPKAVKNSHDLYYSKANSQSPRQSTQTTASARRKNHPFQDIDPAIQNLLEVDETVEAEQSDKSGQSTPNMGRKIKYFANFFKPTMGSPTRIKSARVAKIQNFNMDITQRPSTSQSLLREISKHQRIECLKKMLAKDIMITQVPKFERNIQPKMKLLCRGTKLAQQVINLYKYQQNLLDPNLTEFQQNYLRCVTYDMFKHKD